MYLPYADRSLHCSITRPEPSPSGHFQPVTSTHTHLYFLNSLTCTLLHFQTLLTCVHFYQYSLLLRLSLSVSHTAANVLSGRASTLN